MQMAITVHIARFQEQTDGAPGCSLDGISALRLPRWWLPDRVVGMQGIEISYEQMRNLPMPPENLQDRGNFVYRFMSIVPRGKVGGKKVERLSLLYDHNLEQRLG
jgi:hypothetical protein